MLHKARRRGNQPNADDADKAWAMIQATMLLVDMHDKGFDKHPKLGHVLNLHLHEEAVTKAELSKAKDKMEARLAEVMREATAARKLATEAKSEAAKAGVKRKKADD